MKISATALAFFVKNAATKQMPIATLDSCACRDCASVDGAAAYFVDVLHFLDDRGVPGPLFKRRPDLGDIELSCENADTPLPLIALVNEILWNAGDETEGS